MLLAADLVGLGREETIYRFPDKMAQGCTAWAGRKDLLQLLSGRFVQMDSNPSIQRHLPKNSCEH